MTLGAYIKMKRKEQQMTMTRLAQLAGVSLGFMHDFECGRRLAPGIIPRLAVCLRLDVDYLYYLRGLVPPDIRTLDIPAEDWKTVCDFLREGRDDL